MAQFFYGQVDVKFPSPFGVMEFERINLSLPEASTDRVSVPLRGNGI